MKNKKSHWTVSASRSVISIKLSSIYPYRYLLRKMICQHINSFYRQTFLGPLWFFIQPLFTTLIFVLIFGFVNNISTDGIPHALFYLSGIIIWNYFTECVNKTMGVFKDNQSLFSKIYFPRIIIPLSLVIALSVRFGFHIVLFAIVFWVYQSRGYPLELSTSAFLLPIALAITAALGLGTGLLIASLTIRYRDLNFLAAFGIQLMMYATTVIFPLSAVPPQFKKYIEINPVTVAIETFRHAFFQKKDIELASLCSASSIAILILLTGIVAFKRAETNFIDII